MTAQERITSLDYIRMTAPFMVMLVHASENFYGADSSGVAGNISMLANESNRFWVSFYDGGVSRTCVPLFIMVSAYLLVPVKRNVSMAAFYKRRFLRVVPPMIVFMLLYTFLPLLWGGTTWEQSMADLKLIPFNFPSMAGHLWFMYPLISLYLIIPVVSPWLERVSAKEERIFLYIFAFSTLIPWLRRYVAAELWGECFWNEFNALWYCSGYLGYMVLAHYIRFHLHWNRRKKAFTGAVCFLAGAVFTGWSFYLKGVPGVLISTPVLEWAWEFPTPNVLVATFGAFLLFDCISRKKAPALVTGIAKMSYGIYLMHLFFLSAVAGWFVGGNPAAPRLPVYLAIPCIAAVTYVCCVITAKIISFLPGSKYIVGN